jgi:hypothetical protein
MALLNGGFWPTTYWAENYFDASYWPEFSTSSIAAELIPAGYWQPRYWAKGYWAQNYWPRFSSADIDTLLIPIGYWIPVYWAKGYWAQTYWPRGQVAVVFPTPIKQRKQKAHGWNRYRLLQWGGRFPPKC